LEKLEQEKLILDERVDNSRYGYIVTRKDYYQSLIKKMEDLSLQLNTKIQSSHSLFENLLDVTFDKQSLNGHLYDIIQSSVKIGG